MTVKIFLPRTTLGDRIANLSSTFRWKFFPPKSNLVRHAERELALLSPSSDDMQSTMNAHILRMVRTFAREGHSGFSAGYAISILQKLLRFEPLLPLTGKDDEWMEISEDMGRLCYQNVRCSRVFKEGDGQAYDSNARVFVEPDGSCFTGRGSSANITFPYSPSTEYINVGEDGEPLQGPSREALAAERGQ